MITAKNEVSGRGGGWVITRKLLFSGGGWCEVGDGGWGEREFTFGGGNDVQIFGFWVGTPPILQYRKPWPTKGGDHPYSYPPLEPALEHSDI